MTLPSDSKSNAGKAAIHVRRRGEAIMLTSKALSTEVAARCRSVKLVFSQTGTRRRTSIA